MTYLAQVSIPYFTAIPTDVITNTFHVSWLGPGSPLTADYTNLRTRLTTFYNSAYSAPQSMASYCRPTLTTIKVYDLSTSTPRVPASTSGMALTVALDTTTTTLPPEVAICLSYKAAPTPGTPLPSLRGRVYLGGLGSGMTSTGLTNTFPSPSSILRTNLKNAATNLLANLATDNWGWVVYSRLLTTTHPIVGGFIDDAYDTQRRRGQLATTRTLWP